MMVAFCGGSFGLIFNLATFTPICFCKTPSRFEKLYLFRDDYKFDQNGWIHLPN